MPARAKHHEAETPIAVDDKPAPLNQADAEQPEDQLEPWQKERHEEAKQGRTVLSAALRDMDDHDVLTLCDFYRVMQAYQRTPQAPVEEFIMDLPMRWKHALERGEARLTPDDIVMI